MRAVGLLNCLADIKSQKNGVVFPRAHAKMKTVWKDLHPVPIDEHGVRTIPVPNLADFAEIPYDHHLIGALKEGLNEAQKLLRVLDMAPSTYCSASKAPLFKQP